MIKDKLHCINKGALSRADCDFLSGEIDPSKNKKYLQFIIKAYLAGANLDLLRNRVTEYETLVSRNQVDKKDINSFKTFRQLDEYVKRHNNIKSTRELKREMKKEAEIILDTEDIFIVSPQSHAASCFYGAGTRWCTTAKNSVHWERYFYGHLVTFYYLQVRSEKVKQKLKQEEWRVRARLDTVKGTPAEDLWKIAVVVFPNGRLSLYDAADRLIGDGNAGIEQGIQTYPPLDSLGLDSTLFVPRGIDERLDGVWQYKWYDTTLDLSGIGIQKIPDSIGCMIQLEKLILSENKIQALPESIGQLANLKTLYLFYNQLASLPQSLGDMKRLQWLGLTGNENIHGKVIRELRRKLPDTKIYMRKV